MTKAKPKCKYCGGVTSLFLPNHIIGCNLEAIAGVLRVRGLLEEAQQLEEIGARLK